MDAIKVENISKIYRIYNKPSDRLKEAISIRHKKYHNQFYALKNISFRVEKGETIGIIGTNGSGKSTMLKIITGVLRQSEGQIEVNGKVSALLELGAGFDQDYTGIENIYMNGSIMGYSKSEMDARKDTILEFADIGDFIYQPVKTYSSGMLVRLAFALAINVEPEILIIDEALAVGDAFFQVKCYHKLEEIKKNGTTILFVSHDIASVKKMCSRVIWIEKGVLRETGGANTVCERYLGAQIKRTNEENKKVLAQIKIDDDNREVRKKEEKVWFPDLDIGNAEAVTKTENVDMLSYYIRDDLGTDVKRLTTGCRYQFGIVAQFHENLEHVILGVEMENLKGVKVFSLNNYIEQKYIGHVEKGKIYEVVFSFVLPKICMGEYLITPAVASGIQESHVVHVRYHNCQKIMIENEGYNMALIELETETTINEYEADHVVIGN